MEVLVVREEAGCNIVGHVDGNKRKAYMMVVNFVVGGVLAVVVMANGGHMNVSCGGNNW
ncbi:hypothetical protein ACLOJK_004997 [Asimina triloba]